MLRNALRPTMQEEKEKGEKEKRETRNAESAQKTRIYFRDPKCVRTFLTSRASASLSSASASFLFFFFLLPPFLSVAEVGVG